MSSLEPFRLEELARSGAAGDPRAARELVQQIRGVLERTLASNRNSSERGRSAAAAVSPELLTSTFERPETLQGFATWRSRPRNRTKSFLDWLEFESDEVICDTLAQRAARGDRAALKHLIGRLHDGWVAAIRDSWRLRESLDPEDDARNIALRLIGKLEEPQTLRAYVNWRAQRIDKRFRDWMNIVVANTTRSYVKPSRNSIRNLVQMNTPPAHASVRPPFTDGYFALQLESVAGELLDAEQLSALNAWLQGGSFEDIAQESDCSEAQAQRQVRAAIAKLRRKFLNDEG